MTAPMPKDNEVDEKVVAFAMTDHQDDGPMTILTTDRKYAECWAAEGIQVEPLYSAATVAELRAEVERLREANQLYSFAMNTAGIDELKRRADAAERRVGELRHALVEVTASLAWLAHGECRSIHDGPIMPSDKAVQFSRATLTGADPT